MSARPGFTLLEMMVVLTLLGGIAVAGYQALGIAGRTAAAIERMDDGDTFLTRRMLAGWVEEALPVPVARQRGAPMLFRGEPERLSFVADLPGRFGVPGPHVVTVRAGGTREAGVEVSWHVLRQRADVTEQVRTLVAGVGEVTFRYWGDDGNGGVWRDSWIDQLRLPSLVEIRLGDGAPAAWRPIVVPVGAGG